MDACNTVDIGFSGPKFTWTNLHQTGGLIREWIDQFGCNPEWQTLNILHLLRFHSDHCPILLNSDPSHHTHHFRPFHYELMWLSDPSFYDVSDSWADVHATFHTSAQLFIAKVKYWNK